MTLNLVMYLHFVLTADGKANNTDSKKSVFVCETCGKRGSLDEFRGSGRFCSQACVGLYASK